MSYSKCKYWKLAHHDMNCKNCMVSNKYYCYDRFYKAEDVNLIIDNLETEIEQLQEEISEGRDNTREMMRDDYD